MDHADRVRAYYGETLADARDLRTTACCTPGDVPPALRAVFANVHEEVTRRYYGCGLVVPELLDGRRVLDLGCGAGRDVYALAQMVGPAGEVIGVDMTSEQLAVARRHRDWHMRRFGFARPNVAFVEGRIEALDALGLAPGSVDVIVSNCVVNLTLDKAAVFRGAHALLAPGGEMHFADVYCDRRLPASLHDDPVLVGECLAGALYWNDFLTLAKRAGFRDPRLLASRPIEITDPAVAAKVAPARFFSATYRLFRLDDLEPACEDHGQAVVYRGGIPGADHAFTLDAHHRFEQGRVVPACGNTVRMLVQTRLAPWFDVHGDFSRHYGIFPGCGTTLPFETGAAAASGCC